MARKDSHAFTMKMAGEIYDGFYQPLGRTLKRYLKNAQQFQTKNGGELVGDLDRAVQKIFLSFAETQGIGVTSEELERSWPPDADRFWVLDPIDGTHCMAMGLPLFGIMAALVENGEVIFTSIFLPAEKMLGLTSHSPLSGFYFAGKNAGAYECVMPGMKVYRLGVSVASRLSQTNVLFEGHWRGQPLAEAILRKCRRFRYFGSSCYATTRLALGRGLALPVDAVVAFGNKPFDTLPPSLLITEAGGRVTDFNGRPLTLANCSNVVFSNGYVHDELLAAANNSSYACSD